MIISLVGDEQQLDDVCVQVDEEMRLLEEMDEMEIFLNKCVFVDLEDNGFDREVVLMKDGEEG